MARPSSRRRNRTRSPTETPTPADEERQAVGSFRRLPGRPAEADAEFWRQPPDFPSNYGHDQEEARRNNSLRTRARRTAPEPDTPQPVRRREGRDTKRKGRPRSISSNGHEPATGLGALVSTRRGLRISDATISRVSAAVLWVLVILAAYGGITAWLGSGSSSGVDVSAPLPGDVPDGRWAAAGFAERYVTAYLMAGSDGSTLAPYLGYSPELPATANADATVGPVRTVEVTRADDNRRDYWSVTVAVGEPSGTEGQSTSALDAGTEAEADPGTPRGETFWQVGIDTSEGQPVASGLPAPVAGPPEPDRAPVAVSLNQPSTNDPAVESVQGFLAAYLCGAADLDRYLHPEAMLRPVSPPVCQQVQVSRWGSAPVPGTGGEGAEARQTVVAEVVLDSGSRARRATYGLTLAQRDGRWEVAELLPAPPITER